MTLLSPRSLTRTAAAVAAVASAGFASAQDAGGTSAVTFFQQFFLPGDTLGLVVVWLLIVMSFVSLSFTGSLAVYYRRARLIPPDLLERLEELLTSGSTEKFRQAIDLTKQNHTYLSKLTHAALREAPQGYNAMELAVVETGDAETAKALRPLEYLNVLGNIAPMLGLFGTVYGMIAAFQGLVASGGSADPATLAAGIGTALVTTFWGLIVAIPALAAYAVLRNRVDALTADGVVEAERLIRPFKKSRGKSRGGDRDKDKPFGKPAAKPAVAAAESDADAVSIDDATEEDTTKRAADGSMMGGSMMGRPVPNPE
ncbi:MAG: MotA/TolQ/ExbB proton channel family protein [Planctomycetota bacterium]